MQRIPPPARQGRARPSAKQISAKPSAPGSVDAEHSSLAGEVANSKVDKFKLATWCHRQDGPQPVGSRPAATSAVQPIQARLWKLAANCYFRDCLARRSSPRTKEFANSLRLSRDQVARAFSASTGIAVGSYLRARQLSVSARLLRCSPMSVSRVSRRAGFENLRTFLRAFKRATGVTPSEFRSSPQNVI
jgi:AraC-like DNA-binding protein